MAKKGEIAGTVAETDFASIVNIKSIVLIARVVKSAFISRKRNIVKAVKIRKKKFVSMDNTKMNVLNAKSK